MKKKTKSIIYVSTFVIIFIISALIRSKLLGSAPQRLIRVKWNENMGEIYYDLNYENDNGNQFDLYIPSGLDNSKNQNLQKDTLQLQLTIRCRIMARMHQST